MQSYALTAHSTAQMSMLKQLGVLVKGGEAFRGVTPRLIKKPLTNTMAFLMFEMMEDRHNKGY